MNKKYKDEKTNTSAPSKYNKEAKEYAPFFSPV